MASDKMSSIAGILAFLVATLFMLNIWKIMHLIAKNIELFQITTWPSSVAILSIEFP